MLKAVQQPGLFACLNTITKCLMKLPSDFSTPLNGKHKAGFSFGHNAYL
jgi:hypothetical protein